MREWLSIVTTSALVIFVWWIVWLYEEHKKYQQTCKALARFQLTKLITMSNDFYKMRSHVDTIDHEYVKYFGSFREDKETILQALGDGNEYYAKLFRKEKDQL